VCKLLDKTWISGWSLAWRCSILKRDNGTLGVKEKVFSEYRAEAVVPNWPHEDCGTNTWNIYVAEDRYFPFIHIKVLVNQTDAEFVCEPMSSDDVEQALLHRVQTLRRAISFTDSWKVVIGLG